jgi:transposase InsO family protein
MRMEQVIAGHRARLMAVVAGAPSVREGCRRAGIHPSTYYQWLRRVDAGGPGALVDRPGRLRVRSPERVVLEAKVVALALANQPWGPRRLRWELHQAGVEVGSASQVWRILRSHGLNTAAARFRLMAVAMGLADADVALDRPRRSQRPVGRLDAEKPGDLVQIDCFHIGALKEARLGVAKKPGVVWQYTAIDVASSFCWAELHTTAHNPSAVHASALAHRVAADLTRWGWECKTVSTDHGDEFIAHRFGDTLHDLGVTHRLIPAGRPQSNGKVEQVHNTILQECWKPVFVQLTQPSIGALRHYLETYLHDYNHHRPHTGRWNNGTPPSQIIIPNTGNQP